MRICAFDQATLVTGYSLFEDNQCVESGVIKKDKNVPIDRRTQDMAKSICRKIKEFDPELVVIEDIQNQSSVSTVISLARLQGAILFYCANKDIEVKILHPTEWRRALSYQQGPKVKREELKKQSIDYAKEHMGFDIESEDECEAVCIGFAACKLYNTK